MGEAPEGLGAVGVAGGEEEGLSRPLLEALGEEVAAEPAVVAPEAMAARHSLASAAGL